MWFFDAILDKYHTLTYKSSYSWILILKHMDLPWVIEAMILEYNTFHDLSNL